MKQGEKKKEYKILLEKAPVDKPERIWEPEWEVI